MAPGCTFADLVYHKSKSITLINFACASGGKDNIFVVKIKNGKVVKSAAFII